MQISRHLQEPIDFFQIAWSWVVANCLYLATAWAQSYSASVESPGLNLIEDGSRLVRLDGKSYPCQPRKMCCVEEPKMFIKGFMSTVIMVDKHFKRSWNSGIIKCWLWIGAWYRTGEQILQLRVSLQCSGSPLPHSQKMELTPVSVQWGLRGMCLF